MRNISKEALLESELKNILLVLEEQLELNSSYEDLDKSIKIVEQRNKKQYSLVKKKIDNFTRIIFETGVFQGVNRDIYLLFVSKLEKVDLLVNEIIG